MRILKQFYNCIILEQRKSKHETGIVLRSIDDAAKIAKS